MSWCYGSLGILPSIITAGKAIQDSKLVEWGKNQLLKISEISIDNYYLDSPIICHGYAGASVIFRKSYDNYTNSIICLQFLLLLINISRFLERKDSILYKYILMRTTSLQNIKKFCNYQISYSFSRISPIVALFIKARIFSQKAKEIIYHFFIVKI